MDLSFVPKRGPNMALRKRCPYNDTGRGVSQICLRESGLIWGWQVLPKGTNQPASFCSSGQFPRERRVRSSTRA